MKLNRLETHDRLLQLKKEQSINVFQGAEDCIKNNPLSIAIQDKSPYVYIFAHPRTADDGANKRMLWQPRLSKPQPQTNSYLFRAQSKTDLIEVCWMIPPHEVWRQYKVGNVTESGIVEWSIWQYCYNRKQLEVPHEDDMKEEVAVAIFNQVLEEHKQKIRDDKKAIQDQMQKNNDSKLAP